MPKGGLRAGAGRPRKGDLPAETEAVAGSQAMGVTPLEYMVGVMNDPTAEAIRRDRMAIAAAPFIHPKAGEPVGKKAQRDVDAKTSQNGTEWESLLNGPSVQ